MKELLRYYKKKRKEIKGRLEDFRHVYKRRDKDIFAELCFCILTPQAKAVVCDKAIKRLEERGALLKGSQREVISCLKGVRFPNNKARYLILARNFFKKRESLDIKTRLKFTDLFKTRDWLVRNVKGLGYKEASHFLRNIGLGRDLAILDRHILKNLKEYRIIKKIPTSLNRESYINIENKMRRFFKRLDIPMEEIDLLFWSKETGMVFK
jgi:N-glycosylase/DNA lyase